jgi:hypothetical protein
VSSRAIAATLWNWWPAVRTSTRIRPLGAGLVIAALGLALVEPVPGTAGLCVIAVGMVTEMLTVRRGVRRAVDATTDGVSDG